MTLTRRFLLSRLLPGLAGGTVASTLPPGALSAGSQKSSAAAAPGDPIQKVVYHLSEPDRVGFVMGNIKNHIAGKGGPDKVHIVLVIHGPALQSFALSKASPDMKRQVEGRAGDGVAFVACGNTMSAQKLSLNDMPAGFSIAEEGGVVRIADLQAAGYLYIRP